MHEIRAIILIASLIALPTSVALSQDDIAEPAEIETDRDSFTPATSIASQQRLIVEAAYSFIDNRAVPETHSYPELIARYGVNDWLELRLGWNSDVGGAANTISGNSVELDDPGGAEIERGSQLLYGVKLALTSQYDWIPESAVILQAGTPTCGEDTSTQLVTTYVVGYELANRWKVDSAIRYAYDSALGDHFNTWAPSTVLKIPLDERWAAHAEYFGLFSDGRADDRTQHYLSPGIHCLLTPDLEVGIRTGWGLNQDSANFFANIGCGWQF